MQMTTPMASIEQHIQQQLERNKKAIINAFEYIGVACQNEARENGSYTDRTGNLRSSIGYAIIIDGQIHSSSTETTIGGATANQQILQLASKFPHGIALVMVAGMNYAAHVEAINLNVLTSAELLAEKMVPALMKQLGFIPK